MEESASSTMEAPTMEAPMTKEAMSQQWEALNEKAVELKRKRDAIKRELHDALQTQLRNYGLHPNYHTRLAKPIGVLEKEENDVNQEIQTNNEKKNALVKKYLATFEGKEITKEDITPSVMKTLKVGDKVSYSRYRDTDNLGDPVGLVYNSVEITKKKGGVWETTKDDIDLVPNQEGWLNVSRNPRLSVVAINGVRATDGLDGAVRDELVRMKRVQEFAKKQEVKQKKGEEDWTKKTALELREMIREHAAAQGKQVRVPSSWSKKQAMDYIIKHKIAEVPSA
jgi:hypothetical protein